MHAMKIVLASCVVFAASTTLALAHAGMKASNIAANAVIDVLPAAFTMSFTQPVGLAAFTLENETGVPITLDFTPPKGMATEFSIPLPRLAPGRYLAKWRTMAKDGHAMAGEVRFTLAPKPQE